MRIKIEYFAIAIRTSAWIEMLLSVLTTLVFSIAIRTSAWIEITSLIICFSSACIAIRILDYILTSKFIQGVIYANTKKSYNENTPIKFRYGKPIREWTSEEYLNFCPTYAYQLPYSSIHTDIVEANAHCVETREFTCKPNDVKYSRMIFYRDYDYQKQKYIDEPRDGVCHLEEEFFGEYENWKYK